MITQNECHCGNKQSDPLTADGFCKACDEAYKSRKRNKRKASRRRMPTHPKDVTNFDAVRRIHEHLRYTRETERLNTLRVEDLVRAVQTVRCSEFDVFIDQLTVAELRMAVACNVKGLNTSLEKRLT